MKLFLDANVLFSAANPESHLHRLVQTLKSCHELITSDYALAEALRNLETKRAQWVTSINMLMDGIAIVPGADRPLSVEINAKDRPILATALRENCDTLVTGDKRHFSHLFDKRIGKLAVFTPLMLVERLRRN